MASGASIAFVRTSAGHADGARMGSVFAMQGGLAPSAYSSSASGLAHLIAERMAIACSPKRASSNLAKGVGANVTTAGPELAARFRLRRPCLSDR